MGHRTMAISDCAIYITCMMCHVTLLVFIVFTNFFLFVDIHYDIIFLFLFSSVFFGVASHGSHGSHDSHDSLARRLSRPVQVTELLPGWLGLPGSRHVREAH